MNKTGVRRLRGRVEKADRVVGSAKAEVSWRRGRAAYRGEVSAENRATSARGWQREKERKERGGGERYDRETEREGVKGGGVGRFVPAWLPSLGWWAIAAMRAPMRPSGGAETGYPLRCTDYALSLCTDYALSPDPGEWGVGSRPGKLQVLSSLLRLPAYMRLRNQATLSSPPPLPPHVVFPSRRPTSYRPLYTDRPSRKMTNQYVFSRGSPKARGA